MEIILTKKSDTHHLFAYQRDDGSGESIELESKTFLVHDFIHFVVETEAGLQDSFFGSLQQGQNYDALFIAETTPGKTGEAMQTERIVGLLTGFVQGRATAADIISGLQNLYEAYGEAMPRWLSIDFVEKVGTRMKALLGEWNKLPYGQTMSLEFH